MTVFIIPNTTKPRARTVTAQAVRILRSAGANVILAIGSDVETLPGVRYLPKDQAFTDCDVVITIGGDGTILHTAKDCLEYDKPILGINLGRMGFLATCEVNEMQAKLTRLANGQFQCDKRMLLNAIVDDDISNAQTALNDVVIYKGHRLQTIDFNIYCDAILVNHCSGDGVIISTPTGSTAYSLSAGGPILDVHIEGIVVSMICAHSLHQPSMVFAADRCIRIEVNAKGRNEIFISTDGEEERSLRDGGHVEVELSRQSIRLVTFSLADQFDAIDRKLRGR